MTGEVINAPAAQGLRPDLDQVVSFVLWLREPGPWVLTAISNDRQAIVTETFEKTELGRLREWVRDQNEAKQRNCYYALNPLLRKMQKKAEKTDVAGMDWLHVDIDPNPGEDIDAERKRILAMLESCPGLPKPTCIVFSGGGYQCLWRLDNAEPINGDVARAEDLERYNIQVELLLGADRCHNVDRVLRLPGTINHPDAKKRAKGQVPTLARVIEQHDDRVYSLSRFTKAPRVERPAEASATAVHVPKGNVRRHVELDELPAQVSGRVKMVLVQGKDMDQPLSGADQTRSAWLLYACGELVRAEVPDETVYSIITDSEYAISASVLDKGNSAQVHRYALRQIKRAKEKDIAPELMQMNDEHCVIKSFNGKCRVLLWEDGKPRFQSFDDFRNAWCNQSVMVSAGQDANGKPKEKPVPLGEWWLKHPERRQYKRVKFDPGAGDGDGSVLNLWDGLALDPQPGDCGLILAHLREIICAGDERLYQYLLKWLAWKVQHPGERPAVALVLLGLQGTGKGTLWDILARIFGRHALHISRMDQVTGKFNKHLMDKCLVFADEAFVGASKADVGNFKRQITDETIFIEPKGVDSDDWPNPVGYIIASNLEHAVYLDHDDRRTVVFEVSNAHKEDEHWFGPLRKQIDDGGCAAFLHHLLTMDLGTWHPRHGRPNTAAKDRQKAESLSGFEAVWYELLQEGAICHYATKDGRVWVPTDWLIDQAKRRGQEVKYNHVRNLLVGPQGNHHGKPGMAFEQIREDRGRGYVMPKPNTEEKVSSLAQARCAWDRARFRGDWDNDGGEDEWVQLTWDPRAI